MHRLVLSTLITIVASAAALPASAGEQCTAEMLKGRYVFTATGATRPAASTPGVAWTPKAIVEVVVFNGDGSLTTPFVTVANAFGDTGGILNPPGGGAPGAYIVNEDCTGRIHFFDATGAMFNIVVEPKGETVWMIQVNPVNNVFQGTAKRVS